MINLPDISQLVSPPGIMGVIIGALGMRLIEWAHAKYLDRKSPADAPHTIEFNPMFLIWLIVAITIAAVAVKTEEAWDCMRLQAKVMSSNQQLIIRESDAQRAWLETLLAPPPHIKDLPSDNPVRREWAIRVTLEYQAVVAQVAKQRTVNEQVRVANWQCLG